ncbi:MAG: type I DNA topoisomerase, partial [Myxococcota bacterium]|nr:type I DNA topoisomerase [Myxococcota bacterium]
MARAAKSTQTSQGRQSRRPAQQARASKPAEGSKTRRRSGTTPAGTGTGASDQVPQKALVVVESPAKARTIKKFLGSGVTVQASVGHIKDLPKSKIGVDIEHDFTPEYVVIRGKGKIIANLRKAAREADVVYLAPDPDREGEAIAWHIAEEIRSANSNIKRVLFNEITQRGVTEALAHPTELDPRMYDAQQARRILDRLVGYQISPLLWSKVRRGLSAGRVQSVAVRMIVEREAEIAAFRPVEYWTVEADVEGSTPPPFHVRLVRIDGQRPEHLGAEEAQRIVEALRAGRLRVQSIERKERRKNPPPPFTTSLLQQEAAHKLRFTAKRTMSVAQRLYEGVDLGAEGAVGLITYMRTDSTRLSDDALREVRAHIRQRYGPEFLPDEPVIYRSKKAHVQDAHEAIRPTSLRYDPETVRQLLRSEAQRHPERAREIEDQIRLYQLIWNRFVACQMRPALYDQTTLDIVEETTGRYVLRATGQVLKSPGFTLVYSESQEEDARAEDSEGEGERLPALAEGETVQLRSVEAVQHFTQPPPRFSEASLVRELEEKGIGRPSTYATILSTIQERGYVEKRDGRFVPTPLGTRVNELLVRSFPDILNVDFTALMEEDLDKIEEGEMEMKSVLHLFYGPFKAD